MIRKFKKCIAFYDKKTKTIKLLDKYLQEEQKVFNEIKIHESNFYNHQKLKTDRVYTLIVDIEKHNNIKRRHIFIISKIPPEIHTIKPDVSGRRSIVYKHKIDAKVLKPWIKKAHKTFLDRTCEIEDSIRHTYITLYE